MSVNVNFALLNDQSIHFEAFSRDDLGRAVCHRLAVGFRFAFAVSFCELQAVSSFSSRDAFGSRESASVE